MASAIDYFSYNNPFIKIKTYFSLKARRKMYNIFVDSCHPTASDSILDLGATPDTTLADSNFFEKLYPYRKNITVTSIEDCSFLVEKYGLKDYIKNEPHSRLPFEDGKFDILFCSAVLEHVGGFEDQEFFLRECLRVSNRIFLTTPNRYFPLEMHTFLPFLHWLPWGIFQRIVKVLKGNFWADTNNLHLLSRRDILKMMNGEVDIRYVWTMGMKSNIIVIRKT